MCSCLHVTYPLYNAPCDTFNSRVGAGCVNEVGARFAGNRLQLFLVSIADTCNDVTVLKSCSFVKSRVTSTRSQ